MQPLIFRPVSWALFILLTAGVILPASGLSAQEAGVAGETPVSFLLSAARAEYDRDPFCVDPDDWFTTFRFSVERGAFGVSVASVDAYPWPLPPPDFPPDSESAFIDRGSAYQVGVHVDPLRLFGRDVGGIGDYLAPFVGGGLHISTEGEAAQPGVNGPEPTFALQGGTDGFLTYGARLDLPLGGDRFGVFGEVRGTSVFDGGKELVGIGGEPLDTESGTLTWAEFSVGVRLQLR